MIGIGFEQFLTIIGTVMIVGWVRVLMDLIFDDDNKTGNCIVALIASILFFALAILDWRMSAEIVPHETQLHTGIEYGRNTDD